MTSRVKKKKKQNLFQYEVYTANLRLIFNHAVLQVRIFEEYFRKETHDSEWERMDKK